MRETLRKKYTTGVFDVAKIERSVLGHIAAADVEKCKLDRQMLKGLQDVIIKTKSTMESADSDKLQELINAEKVIARALTNLTKLEAGVCECCGATLLKSRLTKVKGYGLLCESCYNTIRDEGELEAENPNTDTDTE